MITVTFLHCDAMKITDELNSVVSWNQEVWGCGHCDTMQITDELNSVVSWNPEALGCGCDRCSVRVGRYLLATGLDGGDLILHTWSGLQSAGDSNHWTHCVLNKW